MLGKPREGFSEGRLEGNLPLERLMGNMPPFPSCPVEAELALWPRAGDRGDIPRWAAGMGRDCGVETSPSCQAVGSVRCWREPW